MSAEILSVPPVVPPTRYDHPLGCLLPNELVLIITILVTRFGVPSQIDGVELFAGCHAKSNGLKSYGYSAAPRPIETYVSLLHRSICLHRLLCEA
jgi:hypothetical protein